MSAWCSITRVMVCVLALSISGQNYPMFMSRVAAARQLQSTDVCDKLKMRVVQAGFSTAVIAMELPLDESAMLQYYTGKFPTQDTLSANVGAPSREEAMSGRVTVRHRLVDLEPGESYTVVVTSDAWAGCTLVVATPASKGHKCDQWEASDLKGHDLFWIDPYGSVYGKPVQSAQECCDICAGIQPFRPYRQSCRFFTFEVATNLCFLKDATAMEGKVDREGYTSGEVVLV